MKRLILFLGLACPPAMAGTLAVELEVHGRIDIHGTADLTAQVAGYVLGPDASVDEVLEVDGTYQHWQVHITRYRQASVGPVQPRETYMVAPARLVDEGPITGQVHLHGTLGPLEFVRVRNPLEVDLAGGHAFTVEPPAPIMHPVLDAFPPRSGLQVVGSHLSPGLQPWPVVGEAAVVVYGPTLTTGQGVLATGTTSFSPGPGVVIETADVIVLNGTIHGMLDDAEWQPVLSALTGTLGGDITFYHTRGNGEVNGTQIHTASDSPKLSAPWPSTRKLTKHPCTGPSKGTRYSWPSTPIPSTARDQP